MPEEKEKDLEPGKWGGQWQTAYRSWKMGFNAKKEPRLGSVSHGGLWEPGQGGEISSDWEGEEKEGHPFSKSSKGLYSLKSLEEVKEHGYAREGILGSIIPYGEVVHGERGYRSTKAKVSSLFRNAVPCYVCSQPARILIRNDEKFAVCEKCYKRLERLIQKKGFSTEDIDDILKKLADIYDAEVTELGKNL